MAKQTHHAVLLLDRSGSMCNYVPVTIKGVNEFIATAKNVQKETKASIKITMVGFENDAEVIDGYDAVPVQRAKPVTTTQVFGNGGTQMNDGIAYTLKHLLGTVKDGDTVFVGIFTDGDTSGDKYSAAQIKKLVEASGSTFAFMTPKNYRDNGVQKGAAIGIPESNVMVYEHSQSGFRSAFYRLSRGLRKYLTNAINHDDGVFRIDGFFEGVDPQNSVMKANGLEVTLNMPEQVADPEAKELPPYAPVEAYVVDEYPACPSHWMNGSSKAASYFVPVKEGHGMWLDFNKLQQDEHDIAVVISVQGINPITGQKTSALRLEKYEKNCPVHNKEFGQENFCKDCGFKWPTQNYISTNAAPNGQFWLDGFRDGSGKVRQYIFTEEQARGVAKAVIGDDRVFAIGIAFFKSKAKKPVIQMPMHHYGTAVMDFAPAYAAPMRLNMVAPRQSYTKSVAVLGDSDGAVRSGLRGRSPKAASLTSLRSATKGGSDRDMTVTCSVQNSGTEALSMPIAMGADSLMEAAMFEAPVMAADAFAPVAQVQTKSFEVGHGAKIDQQVHADTNSMDYWQEEPFACLYVNYADEDSVKKILAAGKRKEVQEGFLASIPVSNH